MWLHNVIVKKREKEKKRLCVGRACSGLSERARDLVSQYRMATFPFKILEEVSAPVLDNHCSRPCLAAKFETHHCRRPCLADHRSASLLGLFDLQVLCALTRTPSSILHPLTQILGRRYSLFFCISLQKIFVLSLSLSVFFYTTFTGHPYKRCIFIK